MKRLLRILSGLALGVIVGASGWGCQAEPQTGPTQKPEAKVHASAAKPAPKSEAPKATATPTVEARKAPRDVAWFLKRMVDVQWLAYHEPGVRCRQFSSYDRRSKIVDGKQVGWDANGDAGNYLRENKEEGNVMAEMDGPGCITQFWSANPAGTIRIWLDGEERPSIEMPMAELLSDQGKAPFKEPFCYQVRPVETNQTASNCYFPIPYAKRCKVAVVGAKMYYNIDYITYPAGTSVVTFKLPLTPEQRKVAAEVSEQLHKKMSPDLAETADLKLVPKTIEPGKEVELGRISVTGNGSEWSGFVRKITMKARTSDKYGLRKAVMKIYYDGSKQPGAVAPLVDFFGTGWMPTPYASTMSAIGKDGTMVSRWPMPFKQSLLISVENHGNQPLSVGVAIHTGKGRDRCECKPMYFHAMYRREKLSTTFDYPFCKDVAGPGRLVGNLLNIDNPKPGWWGEGDEKVWVDDEAFPSWWGTGSEDYYNDAWGMHLHARFQEGCPLLQGPSLSNKTSMYRWHILDSIPFEKRLTMTIENYYETGRGVRSDYSSVCYYYNMAPAGSDFYKPLALADLLPCNFRPEGTTEAETLALPDARKRTMEQLAAIGLASEASGQGAVELALSPGKTTEIPLGELKPGVYRVHLYLLAEKDLPGLKVSGPAKQDGVVFKPAALPDKLATGSSSQIAGMLFLGGDKPRAVSLGLGTKASDGCRVYLDAVRLETAPRHGMEAESLEWTSPDHLVTFKTELGDTALSGWGKVTMTTLSVGGLAAIPVELKPGFYEVRGRLASGPDVGQLRVRLDLWPALLTTYEGYADKPGLRDHCFGRFQVPDGKTLKSLEFMICGKNPKSKDTKATVDYLEIRPCKGLTGYEGEEMPVIRVDHGGISVQVLGPAFSQGKQKFITFGGKDGRVQLGFDVPKAGTYEIEMGFCKSNDYATLDTYVDGKKIGPRLDNYSPTIVHTGPVRFGKVELKAGPHVLEFRVVGRNKQSQGYYMGFDYLELKPVK
ncbi:MAG: DUF2961 domain-containing protein [Phycisphaerae bacterium]|nr:DUF2961 domain-containing protein [Phycisphaerae bacterium]